MYVFLAPLGLASGMPQAVNLGKNEPIYFGPKGLLALSVWVKATALLTVTVHTVPGIAFSFLHTSTWTVNAHKGELLK